MAGLKECKGCGKEISKNAKVCPHCGEPAPKKTSLLTWLVLILFIVGIFNLGNNTSTSSRSSSTPASKTPKQLAKGLVSIEKFSWMKQGFGNVMEASFTVKNDSKYTIKDIEIECNHYSKSGTRIDSNTRTIYDVVKPNSTKNFRNFNMGFIHDQANTSRCGIIDFSI